MEEEICVSAEAPPETDNVTGAGGKDGAGTLEVGVVTAASCTDAVPMTGCVVYQEQRSDGGGGMAEAGIMQMTMLQAKLVREKEIKRAAAESKRLDAVGKGVEGAEMEVTEGRGTG